MKKITLPDVSFATQDRDGTVQKVSAGQQLLLIASAPTGGKETMSVVEMRSLSSLVGKLQKAKSRTLILEDEEHKLLAAAVDGVGWGGWSQGAIDLSDAVANPEDIEVKENRASRRRNKAR